jgi:hypothetical protein
MSPLADDFASCAAHVSAFGHPNGVDPARFQFVAPF